MDTWQKRKLRYGKLRLTHNTKMKSIKGLEQELRLYDLRQVHPNYSFKKLAQIVRRKSPEEINESDRSWAEKAYKKCREMIEGGYRGIIR